MERLGSYRIEERLGAGTFATVWKGIDDAMGGPVALKVLADNWSYDADVRERFVSEARALWRISDPRIVRVFALEDIEGDQPWFAMEYAERGSLQARLAEVGPPTRVDDAARLVHQLASCVDAVHRNGLIHRDVKPDNFLIIADNSDTPSGEVAGTDWFASDERVVISDLGQAKALAEATGFTRATGTPGWMAPEQAALGHGLTPAADVFSLGVLARSLLASSHGANGLPSSIEALLARATAEEPQTRPGSALGFADELVALASAVEVAPSAAPLPQPTTEAASSKTLGIAAGAFAVLGLVLVLVALTLLGSG